MSQSDTPVYLRGRPKIERLFRDHVILDILHIAYMDYVQGRFTKIEKLNYLLSKNYPTHSRNYIRKIISITINSHWFNVLNKEEVHLLERGVEVYLNMRQNYWSEKWAKDVESKTKWIIVLAIIGIAVSVLGIYLSRYLH